MTTIRTRHCGTTLARSEALMPAVYCQKCFKLQSDRATLCSKCGHVLVSPTYLAFGVLVVSTMVGACATTLYAAFVSRIWEKWVLRFSTPDMEYVVAEKKAVEGAVLLGIAVFLVSSAVTALIFGGGQRRRRRRRRSQHKPEPSALASDDTRFG